MENTQSSSEYLYSGRDDLKKQLSAIRAAGPLGKQAVKQIIAELKKDQNYVRDNVIEVLGAKERTVRQVRARANQLHSENADLREQIAQLQATLNEMQNGQPGSARRFGNEKIGGLIMIPLQNPGETAEQYEERCSAGMKAIDDHNATFENTTDS